MVHLTTIFLQLVTSAVFSQSVLVAAQSSTNGTSRSCVPTRLVGAIGASSGGRKIGIVIDESSSMRTTDPNNIRIIAARTLNEGLVSTSKAVNGKNPDLVTIVGFNTSPDLYYQLADPSGALPSINGISSSKGGTFIGGGISTAIDELSKAGSGSTANRTGIVVLTDGQDSTSGLNGVRGTINAINKAGSLGIRVSFGFLSVSSSSQDNEILNAILQTGGAFTSFTSATSQESFITQVILQGLTGVDDSSNSTVLLPGLVTSAKLSQTESNKFAYSATAGESFNFTITAIDSLSLKATLKSLSSGDEIKSATTDSRGQAIILHTAAVDQDLQLEVTATGVNTTGIFSVGLLSSLGACANPNGTVTPSPNATQTTIPVQFTGDAGTLTLSSVTQGGCFISILFMLLNFL